MNDHTAKAVGALTVAAATEPDFCGWLANVVSTVAARLDGPGSLTAARPGSWEAGHVAALAEGGWPLDDTAGDEP